MNCSSSMSFKIYYSRFQKHIKDWIILIIQLLISINGECKQEQIKEMNANENNVKQNWENFRKYLDAYFNQLSKLPDSTMIIEELKYPYIHICFCNIQMGLGP